MAAWPGVARVPVAAASSWSSSTTRRAASRRSAASSRLPGSSAPRVVRCRPGRVSARWSRGVRDEVASRTIPASAATACGEVTTWPSWRAAKAAARSGCGSWTRSGPHGRSVRRPRTMRSAWAPAPITPTVAPEDGPGEAGRWVPRAAASPVRQAVTVAESSRARRAPSTPLNRQTTPRSAARQSAGASRVSRSFLVSRRVTRPWSGRRGDGEYRRTRPPFAE